MEGGSWDSSTQPEKMFDDDDTTFWHSKTSDVPKYVDVDFKVNTNYDFIINANCPRTCPINKFLLYFLNRMKFIMYFV